MNIMENMDRVLNKLDAIQDDLTEVRVQTTKTNGRVSALEKRAALIEKILFSSAGALVLWLIHIVYDNLIHK